MEKTKQVKIDFRSSAIFNEIYQDDLNEQVIRYTELTEKFNEVFDKIPTYYFSTPGRVELSGNHTDHNHGKVIAGSINLDSIAAVMPTARNVIELYSQGYEGNFVVDLDNLDPKEEERGTTPAIIRGVCAGLANEGFDIGGFDACISSQVLVGSGLSSSASIEVLIGTIISKLYNGSSISYKMIAMIGQYAENNYFDKPCGLMDQVACASGGIVAIDFNNPADPQIERISLDLDSIGYKLVIVDTGGNHADLTDDYASIPAEMKSVASKLEGTFLGNVDREAFLKNLKELRTELGDRAILRSIHFFEENERVVKQVDALEKGDFETFLKYVNESGDSSFKYLQNIYSAKNVNEQGVSIALALTEMFINRTGYGACRINGGGFAGTIEAFIPDKYVGEYSEYISAVFGEKAIKCLKIRNTGSVCLNG